MGKDGYYISSVYIGNTSVDLYGYNQEIEYAYIGDENITEMLHHLDVWPQVEALAENKK